MNKELIHMMSESDQLEASLFEELASLDRPQTDKLLERISAKLEEDYDDQIISMLAAYALGRLLEIKHSD